MLYREIEKHAEEYKNVAYFCKFDRDSKSSGRETLFLSNGKPILAEDDVKEFFQRVESLSGEIPFFLSYDSVSEFYPVKGIKRSGWPMAAAFEPEKVLHSSYTRNPQESLRGRVSDDISDPGMKLKIEEVRERIISGELLQVVLSKRFDLADVDAHSLLRHFVEGDGSLYVYYYRIGGFEIIGSSPENIITRDGKMLEVHPIAGTSKRGENDVEDRMLAEKLLKDRKE